MPRGPTPQAIAAGGGGEKRDLLKGGFWSEKGIVAKRRTKKDVDQVKGRQGFEKGMLWPRGESDLTKIPAEDNFLHGHVRKRGVQGP